MDEYQRAQLLRLAPEREIARVGKLDTVNEGRNHHALQTQLPDRALQLRHRQVGVLRFGRDGLARRGVLVRHLVMPGQSVEAEAIFGWLAAELSPDTYVNVMGQYRPQYEVGQIARDGAAKYAEIDRRPGPEEIARAREVARRAGLWRFDERRAG